jgi:DNA-binding response OmpR family regulator
VTDAPVTGPPRALVVDDAPEYRRLIAAALENDGFSVEQAGDGEAALGVARTRLPDVVVLDLGLPGLDGMEVCRRLRTFSDAYVIMLTSRDDEVDSLMGLAAGADDYVVKPASGRLVVARARAMLRRPRRADPQGPGDVSGAWRHGDLTVDGPAREVHVAGRPVDLTRIEFDILAALIASPRIVITREAMVDAVWGANWYGDDHVLEVHVSNLRRKIGAGWVRTVRGVGYRIGDGG